MHIALWGSSTELGKLCQNGQKHGWRTGTNVMFEECIGYNMSVTNSLDFICTIQSRHAAEND